MRTVTLERTVKGKIHRTTLKEDVPLHVDIIGKLHERALKRNVFVDIDELIDTVKGKGEVKH